MLMILVPHWVELSPKFFIRKLPHVFYTRKIPPKSLQQAGKLEKGGGCYYKLLIIILVFILNKLVWILL